MSEDNPRRYEIIFSADARRSLKKLTLEIQQRITTAISALADEPRPPGAKALQGLPGFLRIRVGKYRIIYQIEDKRLRILIVKIGSRDKIYRKKS
ncbi:MAG: type II toxin-antitoxin system RelE/ParE family toxin [Spirulina sp.]